jgi:hypothetical protein
MVDKDILDSLSSPDDSEPERRAQLGLVVGRRAKTSAELEAMAAAMTAANTPPLGPHSYLPPPFYEAGAEYPDPLTPGDRLECLKFGIDEDTYMQLFRRPQYGEK